MDIHPFVGNSETKAMAVDNILHMIDNYRKCSACKQIVLVWLMDDQQIYQNIKEGIAGMQLDLKSVTLVCDKEHLIDRWKNDDQCEWRIDKWLKISLESLEYFSILEDAFETNDMSVQQIAEAIMIWSEGVTVSSIEENEKEFQPDTKEIAEAMRRVGEMEQLLDRLNYLISKMEKPRPSKALIKEYLEFQQDVKKLDKYYASAEWKKDFEMDEQGVFPPDLKRGVLSEDAIYDALENNEEILERFKQ